ncbi:MAG: hypothetical protein O7F12_03975 [Nitrospirae bacterium]|nr:hypothetical protein [Nitrospirota bacterium]
MNRLAIPFEIGEWVNNLDSLGRALLNGQINALAWQDGMGDLYGNFDIGTLLQSIDFYHVINNSAFDFVDQTRNFTPVQFLPNTSAPENLPVTTKVAKIGKGRSILPHGHLNMVSAFLTLSGEFHVRQYDRLHHDEKFFHLRLRSDHYSQPGQWNSHSDDKNNIHWLTAMTDDTYLLSTKLTHIDPSLYYASNLYVDPYGRDVGNGVIQAERIDFDRAHELYG